MDLRELIAACGMNCTLCQAYQRKGLSCLGRGQESQRKSCQNCSILKCQNKKYQCKKCGHFKTVHQEYCIYCLNNK